MTRFSGTTRGVGATFAQLEGDRQVERSSIYRTCCREDVLHRIFGHRGLSKTKCFALQERTRSCYFYLAKKKKKLK